MCQDESDEWTVDSELRPGRTHDDVQTTTAEKVIV